jgi:hypothetical protein
MCRNISRLVVLAAAVLCLAPRESVGSERKSQVTLGKLDDSNPGIQGADVSIGFTTNHLRRFLDCLNSQDFHDELTNYNCGVPIPSLRFSVTLQPPTFDSPSNTLHVVWNYTPHFYTFGTNRGLHAGLFYSAEKALATVDPGPHRFVLYRPIFDCSKREATELWVKYSKAAEILVGGKTPPPEVEPEEDKLAVLDWPPLPLPNAKARLVMRERSLGKLPLDAVRGTLTADRSFRHVAFVAKRGEKEQVFVDSVEGKPYDSIGKDSNMTFSDNGTQFAYVAKLGTKMLVVANGKEGKFYDWIYSRFNLVFSPDGKQLAYVAGRNAHNPAQMQSYVVIEGRELQHYATVNSPIFSPDSRRFAYSAEKKWNRGMLVVVNGTEHKTYHQIVGTVFSPNSKRLAYHAMTLNDPKAKRPVWDFVVIDGREELEYDYAGNPVFSPDSEHYAYKAVEMASGKAVLVLDGGPVRCGKVILDHNPVFSLDSRHLACVGHKERTWMVLVDGKVLDKDVGEFTRGLTFSPDSRYLAYISHDEGDSDSSIVVNGHSFNTYESIVEDPKFTRDSKHLAYIIKRAGKFVPVLGALEGAEYDEFVRCDVFRSTRAVGGFSTFALDERGVFNAIALRNGEILQLELELVTE